MSEARKIGDSQTEAILRKDLDGIMDFYSEDAVVVSPEGTFQGRDQIREFMRGMIEPFSNFRADIQSQFEAGTKAMDEWVMRMKNTGDLTMPDGTRVAATGKEISLHGADVYEVHDGHITEHHMYYDQAEMSQQLGLSAA